MAVISKPQSPVQRPQLPSVKSLVQLAQQLLLPAALAVSVWWLSRSGYALLAALVVLVVEFWPYRSHPRTSFVISATPAVVMGLATILVVALLPKVASQVAVSGVYFVWRAWASYIKSGSLAELVRFLVVQAMAFEAIFLAAAIWNTGATPVVAAVWLAAFVLAYVLLTSRGDRAASLMAAVWALVAAECAWLFMVWLISYVAPAGFVIVPQPVLVLSALSYCYGGVYYAQRQGALSRARLAEYIVIGLIVFVMVLAATPWHDAA